MSGTAEFSRRSWEDGGTLQAIEALADERGRLIPKVRVVNPGWNDRKTTGYKYMIIYGIIEEKEKDSRYSQKDVKTPSKANAPRAFGALPLGVGRSNQEPEELLDAILKMDITVRRTAGANEKLVFGMSRIDGILKPWNAILESGAIFPAIKVCSNVDIVPLDQPLRLRPIFLTITLLTDAGIYKIPRPILEFRQDNAISLNLLVTLQIGTDFTSSGVKGMINEEGERVTTFMVHIGNFIRKRGKSYSIEYCKAKVDRMDMRFSLGAVGGLSFHVRIAGKMSNILKAQLGYRRTICYSLMDTNPYLNRVMWRSECSISKVTAVFQPSVPKEFKIYDDVLIDNTGKILKQ
ncbi:matrix protein [Bat paramyxovirus]|uniref:Matrix protein n=1 Tax=bat paramyxovirus 16797 TaxID=3070194 RepID=A0AA48FMY3_9MONO|nr:matrix protein [Bat paramyxovirus]AYM47534.1 matrix protein [bat paramyxovirus 16797]